MPDISVRTTTRVAPGTTDLRVIARELREMDSRTVKDLFRRHLEDAAEPFVPQVQASVMAIRTTGEKHTGLRERIAACVRTASWEPSPREVSVAVEMDPKRMPMGERGLPLYMEGVVDKARHNRWRHPVYGHSERPWVQQPSHPYFYQVVRAFPRAAGQALGNALDDITRKING